MTAPQPSPEWDDSIDLRKWVDALIRYKFLIVGIVVAAAGVAAVFSYLVQTPRFESTAGAVLPPANGEEGLGLSLRGYRELATSTAVLESMREKQGLASAPALVRNQLQVSTDAEERYISITASAETGQAAFSLASQWLQAYDKQVQALIRQQHTILKDEATARLELLLPELANLENSLSKLDTSASVRSSDAKEAKGLQEKDSMGASETLGGGGSAGMGSNLAASFAQVLERAELSSTNSTYLDLNRRLTLLRLSGLEKDLVDGENRLRELTWSAIAIDQARLSSLEGALEAEPRLLMGSLDNSGGAPVDSSGKATAGDVMILNPVYLRLAEDQAVTRVRIATNRKEAETLEARNSNLREELRELGKELAEANTIQYKLDRRVARFRKAYEPAIAELDRLEEIEPRLATISSLSAISEPALPLSPVSPQRARNIMLAGALGLMLGVFAAFFLEFYRTTNPSLPDGGQ